jgi:DnaJ-class molecular chaperone
MKILNLTTPLTEQAIKSAYREFVKKNHPDLFKNDKNKDLATKKFKRGTEAYNYLLEHWEDINKIHTTNQSNRTDSNTEHKQTYERDDSCFRAFNKHTYYTNTDNTNNTSTNNTPTIYKPQEKHTKKKTYKEFMDIYNSVFKDVDYKNVR